MRARRAAPIGVVAAVLAIAIAALLTGRILVAGGDGDADRYRYFVATPDPVTFARIAPYAEAAAGEVSYSSSDPLWVICWVEGPRDDRYWYRLEDGTFLPEDVIFPERRGDSSTPPRC